VVGSWQEQAFVDIGGDRQLASIVKLLAFLQRQLPLQLIVVKSQKLLKRGEAQVRLHAPGSVPEAVVVEAGRAPPGALGEEASDGVRGSNGLAVSTDCGQRHLERVDGLIPDGQAWWAALVQRT
jgi:hypothetical protein